MKFFMFPTNDDKRLFDSCEEHSIFGVTESENTVAIAVNFAEELQIWRVEHPDLISALAVESGSEGLGPRTFAKIGYKRKWCSLHLGIKIWAKIDDERRIHSSSDALCSSSCDCV